MRGGLARDHQGLNRTSLKLGWLPKKFDHPATPSWSMDSMSIQLLGTHLFWGEGLWGEGQGGHLYCHILGVAMKISNRWQMQPKRWWTKELEQLRLWAYPKYWSHPPKSFHQPSCPQIIYTILQHEVRLIMQVPSKNQQLPSSSTVETCLEQGSWHSCTIFRVNPLQHFSMKFESPPKNGSHLHPWKRTWDFPWIFPCHLSFWEGNGKLCGFSPPEKTAGAFFFHTEISRGQIKSKSCQANLHFCGFLWDEILLRKSQTTTGIFWLVDFWWEMVRKTCQS